MWQDIQKNIKKLVKIFGPGFITGASDDDPSGIGTYAQTGAQFGYSQLWTVLFSFPFMTVVQEMCGRIGLVTGKGLSGVIRKHYSKKLLFSAISILVIANTINIGADLGAMAASTQLLLHLPFAILLVILTIITIALEVFVSYKTYSRILRYLALSLLAYIVTAFVIKQNWSQVALSTFVPHISFNKDYLFNIVAIFGTTISPYLFFWQSDEEVEEEVEEGKLKTFGVGVPKVARKDITEMRIDTAIGMFFSNLIMFFIIVTVAATLFQHGVHDIQTADQAAQALKPIAGNFASIIFAAGIVGTGFLAVPILGGSAAYAISEMFRWNAGLSKKLERARGFYGVIAISTLIGLLINFTPIKPFQMLYYTAILNGIAAPPLMIMLLVISNNKKIMGNRTNTWVSNSLGWIITAFMTIAAVILIGSFFI